MSFAIPFSPTNPPSTLAKGDPYPQLQLQKIKFDPVRGFVYSYSWRGASQALMLPALGDVINAGMGAECTFERDIAMLEVVDSTSEYTIDSWEIHASEETRDLFSMPDIVAAVYNVVKDAQVNVFAAIRKDLADGLLWDSSAGGSGPYASKDAALKAVLADPTASDLISSYYYLNNTGTTGYRHQSYALKHKSNVSNRWAVNVADVGIDKIYTPAQLFAEVDNPYLWAFPLPARMQFKLAAIPPPVTTGVPPEFLWGWLKSSSTEMTESMNRVNIETDYTLDLWDTYVYWPLGEGP